MFTPLHNNLEAYFNHLLNVRIQNRKKKVQANQVIG